MIFQFLALKNNLTVNDIIIFCLFAGILTILLFLLDFYFIRNSGEKQWICMFKNHVKQYS